MSQYADLAQDIWPDLTPDQLHIMSNALRRAFALNAARFACSASPMHKSPALSIATVRPSNHAGSSLGVAFKQQSDSVEHEKKICNRLNSLYNGRCSD